MRRHRCERQPGRRDRLRLRTAKVPEAIYSAIFFRETPPVGTNSICGNGALSDFRYAAPPTAFAGNTLTASAPAFQADTTSVGVIAPGKIATRMVRHAAIVGRSREGLT